MDDFLNGREEHKTLDIDSINKKEYTLKLDMPGATTLDWLAPNIIS